MPFADMQGAIAALSQFFGEHFGGAAPQWQIIARGVVLAFGKRNLRHRVNMGELLQDRAMPGAGVNSNPKVEYRPVRSMARG